MELLDASSRVMTVRVEMRNPGGLLKPDMFATVHLHLAGGGKRLAVPLQAVVFDNDCCYVIVAHGKTYEKRQVKVLRHTARRAFLTGNLKPGDSVVTEGSLLLFNEPNI